MINPKTCLVYKESLFTSFEEIPTKNEIRFFFLFILIWYDSLSRPTSYKSFCFVFEKAKYGSAPYLIKSSIHCLQFSRHALVNPLSCWRHYNAVNIYLEKPRGTIRDADISITT